MLSGKLTSNRYLLKARAICAVLLACALVLGSCGIIEAVDDEKIRQTLETVEKSIDQRDASGLRALFATRVHQSLSDSDIEALFELFPDGITYADTDSEKYPGTYERREGSDYVKNLEWHKEIIDNEAQKEYIIIINLCTENWRDESAIGVEYMIIYDVEHEEAAIEWLHSVDEEDTFEGIFIFGE